MKYFLPFAIIHFTTQFPKRNLFNGNKKEVGAVRSRALEIFLKLAEINNTPSFFQNMRKIKYQL